MGEENWQKHLTETDMATTEATAFAKWANLDNFEQNLVKVYDETDTKENVGMGEVEASLGATEEK
jgi:hypothetical protein